MNKKISTLMAGVALMGAMSVGAQDKVAKLPSVAPAPLTAGDYVYLNFSTSNYQLDFTGTWTANSHKDSLIWTGSSTVAPRSKAHTDSLLFQVNWVDEAKIYNGRATKERVYTFTNKFGKFAVAKPAKGKTAPAYLKADGELSEWILPEAYTLGINVSLTTTPKRYGCAPYVVATRTSDTDATPLTVYVLGQKQSNGVLEVLEVKYDDVLTGIINENDLKAYISYDDDEGVGELTTSSSADYLLFRIDGYSSRVDVTDLDVPVTSTNIQDALGTETTTPSFAFAKGVSEGEDNFLAAYNWEYTTDGYLRAIGAEQIGTGRDLYLTVDTFFYDEANKRNYVLALDTLPEKGASTEWLRNKAAYEFDIKASFGKDSITIIARNTPMVQSNGNFKKADGTMDVNSNVNEELIIKTFGDKTVLTTRYSGDATATPAITASETPTWTSSLSASPHPNGRQGC